MTYITVYKVVRTDENGYPALGSGCFTDNLDESERAFSDETELLDWGKDVLPLFPVESIRYAFHRYGEAVVERKGQKVTLTESWSAPADKVDFLCLKCATKTDSDILGVGLAKHNHCKVCGKRGDTRPIAVRHTTD